MSRLIVRPSFDARARLFAQGMSFAATLAICIVIFNLGAWYQRQNVEAVQYCASDVSACWYEVDFTNR